MSNSVMVSNGLPTSLLPLLQEGVWLDANKFQEAERQFHEIAAGKQKPFAAGKQKPLAAATVAAGEGKAMPSLASEIQYARQKIQNFLKSGDKSSIDTSTSCVLTRVQKLEKEKSDLNQQLAVLNSKFEAVLSKLTFLEQVLRESNILKSPQEQPKSVPKSESIQNGPANDDDDDDDIDLFGSDEDNEDEVKLKEERLKAYEQKKSKKPALVAKSSVILDVKPWDDETDMKAMETAVRKIESDGLVWGASKLVPLAYGINKLQIVAVVEDDKVSIDWLQETIEAIEDLVQSVDIAAFNKL